MTDKKSSEYIRSKVATIISAAATFALMGVQIGLLLYLIFR